MIGIKDTEVMLNEAHFLQPLGSLLCVLPEKLEEILPTQSVIAVHVQHFEKEPRLVPKVDSWMKNDAINSEFFQCSPTVSHFFFQHFCEPVFEAQTFEQRKRVKLLP